MLLALTLPMKAKLVGCTLCLGRDPAPISYPRPYPHHTQRAETHPQAAQASRRYRGGGAARPTGIGAQLGNEVAVEEIEPRQPARAPW